MRRAASLHAELGFGACFVLVNRRVFRQSNHGEHLLEMRREAEDRHSALRLLRLHDELDYQGDAAAVQIRHLTEIQRYPGDLRRKALVATQHRVPARACDISFKTHDRKRSVLIDLRFGVYGLRHDLPTWSPSCDSSLSLSRWIASRA